MCIVGGEHQQWQVGNTNNGRMEINDKLWLCIFGGEHQQWLRTPTMAGTPTMAQYQQWFNY